MKDGFYTVYRRRGEEHEMYYDRFKIYEDGEFRNVHTLPTNTLNMPKIMTYREAEKLIEKSDPAWSYEIGEFLR